jgi:hypothetical protein
VDSNNIITILYKQTLTIELGGVRLVEKLSSNPTAHHRKSKDF